MNNTTKHIWVSQGRKRRRRLKVQDEEIMCQGRHCGYDYCCCCCCHCNWLSFSCWNTDVRTKQQPEKHNINPTSSTISSHQTRWQVVKQLQLKTERSLCGVWRSVILSPKQVWAERKVEVVFGLIHSLSLRRTRHIQHFQTYNQFETDLQRECKSGNCSNGKVYNTVHKFVVVEKIFAFGQENDSLTHTHSCTQLETSTIQSCVCGRLYECWNGNGSEQFRPLLFALLRRTHTNPHQHHHRHPLLSYPYKQIWMKCVAFEFRTVLVCWLGASITAVVIGILIVIFVPSMCGQSEILCEIVNCSLNIKSSV